MQISGEVPHPKHGDFFLVAQDTVLGHHAKFQLVTNFLCAYKWLIFCRRAKIFPGGQSPSASPLGAGPHLKDRHLEFERLYRGRVALRTHLHSRPNDIKEKQGKEKCGDEQSSLLPRHAQQQNNFKIDNCPGEKSE